MSKAAGAAAAAAAAAAASAAAAREAAEEQGRLPPREIDFSTFSDEALHAYVTHYKLAPHYPPRALFTSAIQCSSVPRTAPTPSDEDDDSAERGSDQDDDDEGDEGEDDEDEDQLEGRPPRKRRRKRHNQSRREASASAQDTNSSLISTAHILPNGGTSRRRAAAVAAAAAVTASSLTGSSAAGVGDNNGSASNLLGDQDRFGITPLEEPDPEDAAALEQLADGTAARAYLSQAVRRHFANLPAPKEGEVVVGFLYRAQIRDKVLKIADYGQA